MFKEYPCGKLAFAEFRLFISVFCLFIAIIFWGCDSGGVSDDSSDTDKPDLVIIDSIEEVQKIGNDDDYPLDGEYALGQDIDASSTSSWNNGKGFEPIGRGIPPGQSFTGEFMGNGNEISNLVIKRPEEGFVGLFRRTDGNARIENLKLTDVNITGNDFVGGLVGNNVAGGGLSDIRVTGQVKSANSDGMNIGGIVGANGVIPPTSDTSRVSEISHLTSDVAVEGGSRVGGIVGRMNSGIIRGARSEGDVSGKVDVGGLIGSTNNAGVSFPREKKLIVDSHSMSNVEGDERVGGLVGRHGHFAGKTIIDSSSATGNVSGVDVVGGLVGEVEDGAVMRSFSNSNITGGNIAGGLVGLLGDDSGIESSYSISSVDSDGGDPSVSGGVGGLAGVALSGVRRSYSAGEVSDIDDAGGFVGRASSDIGVISDGFWDVTSSGLDDGVAHGEGSGLEALSTDEMQGEQAKDNMSSFDFEDTWKVTSSPAGYPALQWEDR